jgi:hypothetical protein
MGDNQKNVTRDPGATSLTWVILSNISHINTCKGDFLYCHLITLQLFWLRGILRFSKIFPIEAVVDMFYPIVAPHNPWGPWIK